MVQRIALNVGQHDLHSQLMGLECEFAPESARAAGDDGYLVFEIFHQMSFTSCLPKFLPFRRPMNASGAEARPCDTDSRYFILPLATSLPTSARPCGHRSRCSVTMKPCSLTRLVSSRRGLRIGISSPL